MANLLPPFEKRQLERGDAIFFMCGAHKIYVVVIIHGELVLLPFWFDSSVVVAKT
jgi:hypothetical protein